MIASKVLSPGTCPVNFMSSDADRERASRSADHLSNEIPRILSELVKIRSTTGAEMEIAHHIAAKMEKGGFETVVVPEPFPERPQVVVYYGRGADDRTLVLNGHMDTVPEDKASD